MVKRSRLRSRSRSKGRLVLLLALAGIFLVMGLHFFKAPEDHVQEAFLAGIGNEGSESTSLLEKRGIIFDRNFKELAMTLDKVSVYADVRDVDTNEVVEQLGPILDQDSIELRKLLGSDYYKVWLAQNISQEKEESINELNLHGIYLHKKRARYYPEGQSAAHVVGFVGKGMGLAGVEYAYNTLLNKYGSALLASGATEVERSDADGNAEQYLVLTIDLKIQKMLEKYVEEVGQKNSNIRIGAMLMDTKTAEIIAQAVYPTFDPNSFHQYRKEDLENIFGHEIAVPATIRKLLWDASLIQNDFEQNREVVPWSIVSSRRDIGSQLRLWDNLGFNDPLATDFMQMRSVSAEKKETPHGLTTDFYDVVVEVATPLQLAAAISRLSIGGRLSVPHVVDRIAGKDGKVFKLSSEKDKEPVTPKVASEIRALLQAQMQPGPLSSGSLETAEISYTKKPVGREYVKNQIFFSLIPQQQPELMLFVFTQLSPFSPPSVETKSTFSLTKSVNKITTQVVAMQKVMSNLSDMMSAKEKQEMNFEMYGQTAKNVPPGEFVKAEYTGAMPDLKGMSLRKSLRLLKDLRLEIQITGTGVVVEQTPIAGRMVRENSLCRLMLKPH
jgi:cell division protein FtsI (penicillin-binding protein 3)